MYDDILEALNTNCEIIAEMTDAINRAADKSVNFKDDSDNIFIKLAKDENTMYDDILKTLKMNVETIVEMKDVMKRIADRSESYTDLALKTLNKDVFEQEDLILNASLGLSGEVGEVNDIIKKYMYHGHKLDNDTKEKIILELGDVCWYVALMAWAIDKTKFEDVLNKNIAKLEKRYHGEFSTEKSINRKEDSYNSCEEKKNDSDNGFERVELFGFLDRRNDMVEKKIMSEEEVNAMVDNLVLDALKEAQEKMCNKDTEKEGDKIVYNLLVDALNEYYIAYYKACYLNKMIDILFENKVEASSRKKQDKTRFIMTAIDKLFE